MVTPALVAGDASPIFRKLADAGSVDIQFALDQVTPDEAPQLSPEEQALLVAPE